MRLESQSFFEQVLRI